MNVLEVVTGVIPMQLATTLKGVIFALATLDTQAMGFLVLVSSFTNNRLDTVDPIFAVHFSRY